MAELKIQVKADITGIEKLIDQLKGLQTYKMYEGADQTLVDLDDVVKIFADHVEAEVAQPQWRCEWIPCSERLPEEGKEVLISSDSGIYIAELEILDGIVYWNETIEYRSVKWVSAWCPLPEPYKGERQWMN